MADIVDARALSGLIGSIYDCALHPDHWDQTLGEIRDIFGHATAILTLNDTRNDRILISKVVGIEPYWQGRIVAHGPEINAALTRVLPSWPDMDEPFIISRHVPAAQIAASAYYQECYVGQGLSDALQYFLMYTPDRFSGFATGRKGDATDRDIELGALLMPHIRRAVTISNVIDARTVDQTRMALALDALKCGVVLTDESGAILHANRSAEEMLRIGRPIGVAGGVLTANAAAANSELSRAIRLAALDEAKIGRAGLSVRLVQPDQPLRFAHVLPMRGSELRTLLQGGAAAAVFISQPEQGDDGATFAAAFGLTRAETEVLASLLAGRTREQTAAHLDVSLATTKTHLINIFAKTGVSRQAELIRLVASVQPPTSADR